MNAGLKYGLVLATSLALFGCSPNSNGPSGTVVKKAVADYTLYGASGESMASSTGHSKDQSLFVDRIVHGIVFHGCKKDASGTYKCSISQHQRALAVYMKRSDSSWKMVGAPVPQP